ncbi:hypothetical protein [Nostoc sp. NIES-3756]|nr:hypothetical protein [Nostoc sp. NIES-3756]
MNTNLCDRLLFPNPKPPGSNTSESEVVKLGALRNRERERKEIK